MQAMKKTALAIVLGLLCLTASAWGAREDFTTYTETDPGADIAKTANTITLTNFDGRNTDSCVYYDYGVNYFSADFTHQFSFVRDSYTGVLGHYMWMMANAVDDAQGIDTANGDFIGVKCVSNDLQLAICENGTLRTTQYNNFLDDVRYYVTVNRDDDAGAASTGRMTVTVCTGNYSGGYRSTVMSTLTLDCSAGEQNDFRYLYAVNSSNDATAGTVVTGTIDHMELAPEAEPLGAQYAAYVDPDATGRNTGSTWSDAYTSMAVAEMPNLNLTTDGSIMTYNCKSSAGTVDTTCVTWSGWTTSATAYPYLVCSDGTYILHNNDTAAAGAIIISDQFIFFDGIHFKLTATSGTKNGIYVIAVETAACGIRFDNCIIEGVCSGAGTSYGIQTIDADAVVYMSNCLVYGFVSGANVTFRGVSLSQQTTAAAYNCTVWNCYYGYYGQLNTTTFTNCISATVEDDFGGASTIDHCASTDGDGTNAIAPAGANWANEFVAIGTDFHLTTGNCLGAGVTDPGGANQPDTDIEGNARPVAWGVGAYEAGMTNINNWWWRRRN